MRAVDNASLSRSHQNFVTQEGRAAEGSANSHFDQLSLQCGVLALQSGVAFVALCQFSLVRFDHLLFHSIELTTAFQFSLLRLPTCGFCGLFSFEKLASTCRVNITVLSQLIGQCALFLLALHVLFQQVSTGFLGLTQFCQQLFLSHTGILVVVTLRLLFLLALFAWVLIALLVVSSRSTATSASALMRFSCIHQATTGHKHLPQIHRNSFSLLITRSLE
ncbi:Uncharacterised protein [Salmonella enterica subsp. enterica serovar Typhi]|nr:Uncharacterised protein [Salmonella enterica subsp. enterica serovar Typhi]